MITDDVSDWHRQIPGVTEQNMLKELRAMMASHLEQTQQVVRSAG